MVGSLLARRMIRINRKCKGLTGEMRSYVWDDKAAERGEERPDEAEDHGPDASPVLLLYEAAEVADRKIIAISQQGERHVKAKKRP